MKINYIIHCIYGINITVPWMFRLALWDTNWFVGELLRCSQSATEEGCARLWEAAWRVLIVTISVYHSGPLSARRHDVTEQDVTQMVASCFDASSVNVCRAPSSNSCSRSRSPCTFDKSAVNTHDRWPAEFPCTPVCLTRGSTRIDKLPFKREATAFLQLCETQDMTCPFTQSQTVLVTRHRVTEAWSNELQILSYCTSVDFSSFCFFFFALPFYLCI